MDLPILRPARQPCAVPLADTGSKRVWRNSEGYSNRGSSDRGEGSRCSAWNRALGGARPGARDPQCPRIYAIRLGPVPGRTISDRICLVLVPKPQDISLAPQDDRREHADNSSDRALPDRLEVRRADLPSDGASARSALLDCRWACCPARFGLPQPSLNTADVRGLAGCTSVADVR